MVLLIDTYKKPKNKERTRDLHAGVYIFCRANGERTRRENKKSGRGQNLSKMKLLTKRNLYKSQPRKKKKKKER